MKRFLFTRPAAVARRDSTRFKPQFDTLEIRDVPATFYFDPTATDNGSGNATFNPSGPGTHVGPFNPTVPVDGAVYSSLDRAVDAAGNASFPGRDTIRIAAGNITMTDDTLSPTPPTPPNGNSGFFDDTGGLDIIGSGVGVTVLAPNWTSTSSDAFGGVVNFSGGGGFSFGNLTITGKFFDNVQHNIATGIAVNDANTTVSINNVQITNILFAANNTQSGIGVNVKNGANVTVSNTTFTNIGTLGISGRDANTTLNVFSNTYTGKGAGSNIDVFVSVQDGATALVTGNRVTNNTGVSNVARSAAVLVQDTSLPGGPASAFVYGNSFGLLANGTKQANDSGVIVGSGPGDSSTADVRFNNIIATFGITANVTEGMTITGYYNYWGNATGPTSTNYPGGTGASVTSAVKIGPIRSGPVTMTAGPDLKTILKTIDIIGPTLAVGSGTGAANDGVATTLALTNQGQFNSAPGIASGQRTAIGDVNGDGVNDIIVGSGPGLPGTVTVYDGKTRATLFQFSVMDGFAGGVFVAAGDFNRDGKAEIAVVPDVTGGPRVEVFDLSTGSPILIQSYYAFESTLSTGLTVAIGDLNNDLTPDLIVVAGPGGAPRVAFFNGDDMYSGQEPRRLINDQYLLEANNFAGFFVSMGDVNGDGFADVILSSNTGGSTRVVVWSGQQLMIGTATQTLFSFFANPADNGTSSAGVRVNATDINGDGLADIVSGDAPDTSDLRVFFAASPSMSTGQPDKTVDLLNINAGIYVG